MRDRDRAKGHGHGHGSRNKFAWVGSGKWREEKGRKDKQKVASLELTIAFIAKHG